MAETNKPEPGPGVQEMAQMAQSWAQAAHYFSPEERLKELERRVEALERIHKLEASTEELKRERDEMTDNARRASLALYQALNYLMAATWRLRGTEAAEALEEIVQAVRRIKEGLD